MNKKIIGILVCMFLISTVLTTVGKANDEQMPINPDPALIEDDVPTWDVGYSWTYSGELNVEDGGINLNIDFIEAYFDVLDDSGGSYKLVFGGDITLDIVINDPPIEISSDDVKGALYISKSTLGIEKIELSMSANVKVEGIPYTVPGDVEITITHQHTRNLIDFPIFVDKVWLVPSTTTSVDIEITLFGFIKRTFNLEEANDERFAICTGMEEITVGSQTYDAYEISYEGWLWTYYAPAVGNFIKVLPFEKTFGFSLEMIATSYPSPNNPLKPETPVGPTTGNPTHKHEYQTKAVDPNDDQIMYIWDWTGDMIPDEWTGFYDSDMNITTEHSWINKGDYEIRVKARDTNGLESIWSDPLSVSMPRNRMLLKTMFMRLLERFPNVFPCLRQRLGL